MKIRYDIKPVLSQLKIKSLRKHQQKPINTIMDRLDTFVIAPTGFGKSAIYQIPAVMQRKKPTVVIEPTIALIHDQVHKLRICGISAAYLDSTMTETEQHKTQQQFFESQINILYLTPERFSSESFLYAILRMHLYMVVVDECHCVLDWGYSFRSDYLRIGQTIDSLPYRPIVVAFTATASLDDIDRICMLLHMNEPQIYVQNLYRQNLIYMKKYAESRKEKMKLLKKYLRKYHRRSSVIYCNTKKAVQAVYDLLQKKYPDQVVKCHSQMNGKERAAHELQFLTGEKSIMVATTAFGMGVDLGCIDLVIHFNMPLSLTDYIQQSGRAGRNGNKAHCILLYSDEDYYTNKILLESNDKSLGSTHIWTKLDQMKEYCDDEQNCLQQCLLHAFDNTLTKPCNHCTNCQKNRRK